MLQSKGKIPMKITRLQSSEGRVIVPWKVVPESPDSVYVGLVGKWQHHCDHGCAEQTELCGFQFVSKCACIMHVGLNFKLVLSDPLLCCR